MVKIGTRQIRGNFSPLLVDIIGFAGHIDIDAQQHQRTGAGGECIPFQGRIAVGAEPDMLFRIDDAEGQVAGYDVLVLKLFNSQVHESSPSGCRRPLSGCLGDPIHVGQHIPDLIACPGELFAAYDQRRCEADHGFMRFLAQ